MCVYIIPLFIYEIIHSFLQTFVHVYVYLALEDGTAERDVDIYRCVCIHAYIGTYLYVCVQRHERFLLILLF